MRKNVKFYMFPGSNSVMTGRLMLDHKGVEYETVKLPPGAHAFIMLALGFDTMAVPALKIDGRRVQGTRWIARALDEEFPTAPAVSGRRGRAQGRRGRRALGRGLPERDPAHLLLRRAPRPHGVHSVMSAERGRCDARRDCGWPPPLIVRLATGAHRATDEARPRGPRAAARAPGPDRRVDRAGRARRRASSTRRTSRSRVEPLRAAARRGPRAVRRTDAPAAELARRVAPDYAGHVGAVMPPEWLAPLRAAEATGTAAGAASTSRSAGRRRRVRTHCRRDGDGCPTRAERTAATRRDLLAAAERRFFRDGYHGTTLDDIADEAGYTKGAVYSTFKSKGGPLPRAVRRGRRPPPRRAARAARRRTTAARRVCDALAPPADRRPQRAVPAAVDRVLGSRRARPGAARRVLAALPAPARQARRARSCGRPVRPERWAIVTLALSNGLALERVHRSRRRARRPHGASGACSAALKLERLVTSAVTYWARPAGRVARESSRVFPLKDNIPTERPAIVTIAFIAINVIVYFVLQKGGIFGGPDDAIVVDWGAIPYEFTHPGNECAHRARPAHRCARASSASPVVDAPAGDLADAFSSMFMHGSILHLGGNMLFLWIFGNNIEDAMGHAKFVDLLPARGARRARRRRSSWGPTPRSRRSAPRVRSRRCSAATSCSIHGRE